ncbi:MULTISPECIES: immunity 53 family protein [Kitasatospora]|uniref:Immunity protein 53 of polymorphic toxin system n=1 Tax=Kitasatospora arboriphila TaxID=258052 RepID=A0ABN1TBH7_9ACTN
MSDSTQVLDWLQNWYADQCDEDWEHEWGVKIATLDNPGWTVTIDLEETDLEDCEFARQDVNRSTHDWLWAWTSEKAFHVRCGPANLAEALTLFRDWATGSTS